jgi:phosphoribosylglycinamide formyltransferase-1
MSVRTSVLLSGGGRTLQNFLDQDLPLDVVQVIASRSDAYGLERARKAGIPTLVLRRRAFADTAAYTAAIFAEVAAVEADLVCLAGWLKLLSPIPPEFRGRVLNIHPALIPAFCGKGYYGHHVHEAALEAGVKLSGCTVHFVDDEYDHGPIVAQRAVPVEPDDTPDTLAARVFAAECQLYPEVIRLYAAGRLSVEGRRVRISPARE